MIRQQINLYVRHEPVSIPLSARRCLWLAGAALVLMLALWGYHRQQFAQIQSQVVALKSQQNLLQQRYDRIRLEPPPQPSPALQAQSRALTERLARRVTTQQMLSQLERKPPLPFALLLEEGLEAQPAGVRIQRLSLLSDNREVQFEGFVEAGAQLPAYLSRVAEAPAYRGASFDRLRLQQQPSAIAFSLNARLADGEASP